MPKTDCRIAVIAAVLLGHTLPLFSQNQAVILRATGGQTISLDGPSTPAFTSSFMPGISAGYYSGNWGVLAEYGAFSSPAQLNLETYTKYIRDFNSVNINSTQWKTRFLLAGISYRRPLSARLEATIDLTAGVLNRKVPSFFISDKTDGSLTADMYETTKTSTAAENTLFALKPEFRLEWFPKRGIVGLNIHYTYLQAYGASEVSTYYRDLSQLRVDGVSEQEIRAQVLKAPILESRSRGPIGNSSFGAGISLKIGNALKRGRQTNQNSFGERGLIHLHKENIVHRDIAARIVHRDLAARNLIAGRLEWSPAKNAPGILTNESAASESEEETEGQNLISSTLSARETAVRAGADNKTYQPVFQDGKSLAAQQDNPLVSLKTSPLYTGHQASGSNALYGESARKTNPLYEDGGMAGTNPLSRTMAAVEVVLIDTETGNPLASTKTDQDGNFFFANVPDGAYAVHILGTVTVRQAYDLHASGDADISGIVKTGSTQPFLTLVTEKIPDAYTDQTARQRIAQLTSDKNPAATAVYSRQPLKTHFETGDKPTSNQRSQPGNPIGGIIVKMGKNPGGSFITTATDGNGRFELNGLKAGDYSLTLIETVSLHDEAEAILPVQNK